MSKVASWEKPGRALDVRVDAILFQNQAATELAKYGDGDSLFLGDWRPKAYSSDSKFIPEIIEATTMHGLIVRFNQTSYLGWMCEFSKNDFHDNLKKISALDKRDKRRKEIPLHTPMSWANGETLPHALSLAAVKSMAMLKPEVQASFGTKVMASRLNDAKLAEGILGFKKEEHCWREEKTGRNYFIDSSEVKDSIALPRFTADPAAAARIRDKLSERYGMVLRVKGVRKFQMQLLASGSGGEVLHESPELETEELAICDAGLWAIRQEVTSLEAPRST